jgi:hypothetical protein
MATGCGGTAKPQLAKGRRGFCPISRHVKSSQAQRKRGKLEQQFFRIHF